MSTVYVVHGEHPQVYGSLLTVHATMASANERAAFLVNVIGDDVPDGRPAMPTDWEDVLAVYQDHFGAQYCYVDITECEMQS